MAMLEGISLDDKKSFRDWATEMLGWLNPAMADVSQGIGGDIGTLLERQQRYTAYAGTVVEIYAKADAYYKTALAEATVKYAKHLSPSLVSKAAEQDCVNECRVFDAVKRFNKTLSDQLIAIASRLRFERAISGGNGNNGGYNDIPDGINGGGHK